MENVYVLVAYVGLVIAAVGCFLLKVGDIFETKRDQKYYQMIKEDAAFWQMKIEQTGMNIGDWLLDEGMDRMMDKTVEMTKRMIDG